MAGVLAYAVHVDVLFLLGAFSPRVILNLVGSVLSGVSQNQEGGGLWKFGENSSLDSADLLKKYMQKTLIFKDYFCGFVYHGVYKWETT